MAQQRSKCALLSAAELVTLGSKREGCLGKIEVGTWRKERGGTTRQKMKEIDGRKAAAKREERKLDGGGMGRVGVLSGGNALSEVAMWNHPGSCNS